MIEAKRNTGLMGCEGSTARILGSAGWVAAASLGWALCFVGAAKALDDGAMTGIAAWAMAAVPTLAGAGLLVVYVRYLRSIDELQRTIHLEALAIGFGGGFLAICAYMTFEPLGAPAADPLDLLAAMPVLYAVALIAGTARYR